MHIITRKRLNQFAEEHPDIKTALDKWYQEMKKEDFNSISELRQIFPTADKVGKLTVFNIGGNK
jgi:mRNA interferase HigB